MGPFNKDEIKLLGNTIGCTFGNSTDNSRKTLSTVLRYMALMLFITWGFFVIIMILFFKNINLENKNNSVIELSLTDFEKSFERYTKLEEKLHSCKKNPNLTITSDSTTCDVLDIKSVKVDDPDNLTDGLKLFDVKIIGSKKCYYFNNEHLRPGIKTEEYYTMCIPTQKTQFKKVNKYVNRSSSSNGVTNCY